MALIEKIMPEGYYVHPMIVSRADQCVLEELANVKMPQLMALLQDNNLDLPVVAFHW